MVKPKIGVALGGGAARGWSHIGVLTALERGGLKPDIVVGTSIGAIVGGHYAANHLDTLSSFATRLTKRKVLSYLDFSVSGSGLISGQRLFDHFEDHLGGLKIEDLPISFASVATDLGSGQEVWMRRGSVTDALRASSAIPGIVRPVKIKGRWLIDGCLVNPIPVSVCRALGADLVIAVNLTGDASRGGILLDQDSDVEDDNSVIDTSPPITRWNGKGALQLLHRQVFGQIDSAAPGITSVILKSFSIFHDRIARARLMGDPPDYIIAPEVDCFGSLDFHCAVEMIERGAAATESVVAAIQRRLTAEPVRGHSRLFAN